MTETRAPWPDLQEMVRVCGGYDQITATDWAQYDWAMRRLNSEYRRELRALVPYNKNRRRWAVLRFGRRYKSSDLGAMGYAIRKPKKERKVKASKETTTNDT